jgi:MFS family permease
LSQQPLAEHVPAKHDPFAALKEPGFTLYTASRLLSTVGQQLLWAVMAWQVYEISGSALNLGLLGLIRFVPALVASLVGGAAADAFNRRTIVLVSQTVPLTCGIILALATYNGWIEISIIYALVFALGLASSFEGPARQSMLPSIVSPRMFPNAVALSATLSSLGMMAGPAIGGGIIAAAGIDVAYMVFVALSVGAYVTMLALKYSPIGSSGGRRAVSMTAIQEGVSYVRTHQVVIGSMTLDMCAVIFGGAQALLPVYAEDILHVGSLGYGILYASLDAGAFIMSIIIVARPPIVRAGRALICAVFVYGLFTLLFGVSREFALSVALYGLIGAADEVSVIMRNLTIQLATPDELRGRVSAVNSVFIGASNQMGAMESGFLAALTSATTAVVTGGIVAMVVPVLVWWRWRELWDYRIPDAFEVGGGHARPAEPPSKAVEADERAAAG